jgi:hypothetical protein
LYSQVTIIDPPGKIILNEHENKILVELFLSANRELTFADMRERCKMSYSTWYKGKNSLIDLGLIEIVTKEEPRIDGSIPQSHFSRLTKKGNLVAGLLIEISTQLSRPNSWHGS